MIIKWTKEALSNLQDIEDFISQDNPTAAVQFIDKLISVVENLKDFPKRGRVVPELSFEQIREVIYKNYRIVYLIKKKSIEVLTVFECHKLLDKEYMSPLKKVIY